MKQRSQVNLDRKQQENEKAHTEMMMMMMEMMTIRTEERNEAG